MNPPVLMDCINPQPIYLRKMFILLTSLFQTIRAVFLYLLQDVLSLCDADWLLCPFVAVSMFFDKTFDIPALFFMSSESHF